MTTMKIAAMALEYVFKVNQANNFDTNHELLTLPCELKSYYLSNIFNLPFPAIEASPDSTVKLCEHANECLLFQPNFYNTFRPNFNPNNTIYSGYVGSNPNYPGSDVFDPNRQHSIETERVRRLLVEIDHKSSQECTANVVAQWNFETNVNEVTQTDAVSTCSLKPIKIQSPFKSRLLLMR